MKYLITSANSYGNVGDDVCGYSAKYLVEQADPHARVIVTQPPFQKKLVDEADVVIVGGGGVIYDHDYANVENYMRYIDEGKSQKKVTAVLGVGVQGIGTEKGKERYRRSLGSADVVTVRSPVDERLLREIGIDNAVSTQDLGFLTDEWVKGVNLRDRWRLGRIFRQNGKPNLGLAVVDLVAIKGDAFDEASENFVESLNRNLEQICSDFNVYLLLHSADDAKYYDELEKKFDVKKVDYRTIRDLPYFWAAYQKMDLIIGSRFHSIILGCLSGKPVIGISSESTKQNRLANYDMPTLRAQRILFSDMEGVKGLFDNLFANFSKGKYVPVTYDEIRLAKERARKNIELVEQAVGIKN